MTSEIENIKLPDYLAVSSALEQLGASLTVPQCHGTFCALICLMPAIHSEAVMELMFEKKSDTIADNEAEAYKTLVALFEYTWEYMQAMEFGFQLLVPDDQEPLPARIEGLAECCIGFMSVFDAQEEEEKETWSEDVVDAVEAIKEFMLLDPDSLTEENEDEADFLEVYEYVRLAILMIFAEQLEAKVEDVGDASEDSIH